MSKNIHVRFKKLREDAIMPPYMTSGAAGCDFYAAMDEDVEIMPGEQVEIPFGLAMEIPEGYMLEIRSRSGYAIKHRIEVYHGVIDSDYRGELSAIVKNRSKIPCTFHPGDRVAQGVFIECARAEFEEVDELDETDRGENGFGSTGK